MKKVFLNTLFLMLSIISFAQTSDISISVSDAETDGPLLGATVYFEELEKFQVATSKYGRERPVRQLQQIIFAIELR